MAKKKADETTGVTGKSDHWTDLGLTLPIFLVYHLGVVFLPVRNAADPVTRELRALANQSLPLYAGLTLAVGAALVAVLVTLGRGQSMEKSRFVLVAIEGTLYAILMRFAGAYVVGSLRLQPGELPSGMFSGVILSLGAGFYEEIAFRVGLFGLGALGDGFSIESFVFRTVCGLVLTAIYVFRGFAPAVWTHALYDVWVMVLR